MDAADCHLALLLAASDDLTSVHSTNERLMHLNGDSSNANPWSDLCAADWELLLLAVDGSAQLTNSDTQPTPVPTDTDGSSSEHEPRRPCQSQRYRERKRLELAQLRSEAIALQDTLCQLQAAQEASHDAIVPATQEQVVSLAWKRIAMHQKVTRQEVEKENTRLKTALERQLRIAAELDKLMRKRCCTDDEWAPCNTKRQRRHGALKLDASVFQELNSKLQPQLCGVDAMLQQVGFTDRKTDLERMRACDVRGNSIDVEVLFAKVFPFSREMAANAVWRCCSATYTLATDQDAFSAVSCTDSQIEMAFSLPLRVRHCDGHLDAHVVMRRCQEATRTVQWYEGVWILRSTNAMYDGVTLRDRGWHVIEDLASDQDHTRPAPSSIVQCFSRIEFDMSKLSQQSEEETAMLRDVLLRLYSKKQQSSFRMFESALIEQIVSAQG